MNTSMETSQTGHELSINEAAKFSGKSVSTIRRWITNGSLKSTLTKEGWHRISHGDLMTTLSQITRGPSTVNNPIKQGATIDTSTSMSWSTHEHPVVKVLEDSLNHERKLNSEQREQIRKLEDEVVKLNAEIKALLSEKSPSDMLSRWVKSKIQKE